MPRLPILLAVALVAVALIGAAYWRIWGAFALVCLLAAGGAWYAVQVRRTKASQEFFDGFGEETRVTSMQGGSPSELAADDAREEREPGPQGTRR